MAGDWIPYCKDLPRKPEVLRISQLTGRPHAEVVLTLLSFWGWVDEQSEDGVLRGISVTQLSHICHAIDDAFARAMREVGWLVCADDRISVPNFDNWMGKSAKKRLAARQRQRNNRNRLTDKESPVTQVSHNGRDKSVTTEQNSTVIPPNSPPRTKRKKPDLDPAREEASRRVVAHYQSVVRPAHPASRGRKNVYSLLTRGLEETALLRAADGYADHCRRNGTEPKYRKAVGNFYGQDETYQGFVDYQAAPVVDRMAELAAQTAAMVEARRREDEELRRLREQAERDGEPTTIAGHMARLKGVGGAH